MSDDARNQFELASRLGSAQALWREIDAIARRIDDPELSELIQGMREVMKSVVARMIFLHQTR